VQINVFAFLAFGTNNRYLDQRGPKTGTRAACSPRTVFVRPAKAFCIP